MEVVIIVGLKKWPTNTHGVHAWNTCEGSNRIRWEMAPNLLLGAHPNLLLMHCNFDHFIIWSSYEKLVWSWHIEKLFISMSCTIVTTCKRWSLLDHEYGIQIYVLSHWINKVIHLCQNKKIKNMEYKMQSRFTRSGTVIVFSGRWKSNLVDFPWLIFWRHQFLQSKVGKLKILLSVT
jgi:hypothetical protein